MRIRLRLLVSIVFAALLPVTVGVLQPLETWQQIAVACATALTAILFLAQSITGLLARVRSDADASIREQVERGTRDFKRAQRQLIDASKESAVSTLAAGMSHAINNPLTAIRGFTQMLLLKSASKPELQPYVAVLREMENETQRIRDIVESTRRSSHAFESTAFSEVALAEVLDAACARVPHGSDLAVQRHYTEPLPPTRGNRELLIAAFERLLDNAVCAAGNHGTVELRVSALDDELIRVCIRDDGPGMEPAVMHRAFEPFFTTWTESDPRHRGLGLAEARGIIEGHRGSIDIESTPGRGTTATVLLSVARRRASIV